MLITNNCHTFWFLSASEFELSDQTGNNFKSYLLSNLNMIGNTKCFKHNQVWFRLPNLKLFLLLKLWILGIGICCRQSWRQPLLWYSLWFNGGHNGALGRHDLVELWLGDASRYQVLIDIQIGQLQLVLSLSILLLNGLFKGLGCVNRHLPQNLGEGFLRLILHGVLLSVHGLVADKLGRWK